jgi:hypothetical protein
MIRTNVWLGIAVVLSFCGETTTLAADTRPPSSTSPQPYSVRRDDASGLLTLSTPFYTVEHDLKKGGSISAIRLLNGRATNLLLAPLSASLRNEQGTGFSDRNDPKPAVSHTRDGLKQLVTVERALRDEQGKACGARLKSVFEYRWGYVKVRNEFTFPATGLKLSELAVCETTLPASLTYYGYREGTTEAEGAPPFAFGSCKWGNLDPGNPASAIKAKHLPRYLMLADPGVEGIEWFMTSDLAQWDLQLTGRRGQGSFVVQPKAAGSTLAIAPFAGSGPTLTVSNLCAFDYYIGLPLLEGRAQLPWFHTSFNRNRGDWATAQQIRTWAEQGIQTIHCHNDGDYYEDGLFWRDGSYPPYPDMDKYDRVIADAHSAGIRVATYFSNKELHPGTAEFQQHGQEWARKNAKGAIQHNFYKGTNEFGAQMCLRSGWLGFLKHSIDRVLTNHKLDGVYYDWNVALLCCNALHEGKTNGESAAHWDIDELMDLMEWTRERVGPKGVVIVHNTTTPVFATENFANYIVANEWGYGKWTTDGPELQDLPLEWSLVGARPRGVISYGQLDSKSPRRLFRLFALESLLSGVSPWPASAEMFELASVFKPMGDLERYTFSDWRNTAVTLEGKRCASAVYSRAGESYVLLANLAAEAQEVLVRVAPARLPSPLGGLRTAEQIDFRGSPPTRPVDARQLTREGVRMAIPGDGLVLLRLNSL